MLFVGAVMLGGQAEVRLRTRSGTRSAASIIVRGRYEIQMIGTKVV